MTNAIQEVSANVIRSEPDKWRELLRSDAELVSSLEPDVATKVIREFLTACSFDGVGRIDKRETRNILETIVWLTRRFPETLASLKNLRHIALAVAEREDLDRSWDCIQFIREVVSAPRGESIPNQSHSNHFSNLGEEAHRILDSIPGWDSAQAVVPMGLSDDWVKARVMVVDPKVRTEIDVFVLDLAISTASPVRIEFLRQLFYSDDFWSHDLVISWATNMAMPVSEEGFGSLESAMINTRLRSIIPRSFLRRPDALVIDKLADSNEVGSVQDSLREDLGTLIWAAILQFDEVLKANRINKTPIQNLRDSFAHNLSRLSLRLVGEIGCTEAFNPQLHVGPELLAKGVEVLIVEPGLRSLTNGHMVHKIKVAGLTNETPKE